MPFELCYRGIIYQSSYPLEVRNGLIKGKYRGVAWSSRQVVKPILKHLSSPLRYRGNIHQSYNYDLRLV